ncbi:MAG: trypsin-like peptidase domain-containing protein [Gammaproteobacteria bacterium]|nr:trypsin-like peptidase domain-containing protein [Gammaproteobacteria bacterium]
MVIDTSKPLLVVAASVVTLLASTIESSDGRNRPMDAEAMLDASVSISTLSNVHVDRVGDTVWEAGTGSGFLVSSSPCEVWTNHHVVADAAIVEVWPRGEATGSSIPARVIMASPQPDIAILHLEHCDGMRVAPLGRSDSLRPGDEVFAVGNPLGKHPDSITRGIISHTGRRGENGIPYLQTDAAINPGNSGGALFNRHGEVIGMTTAIATTPGGNNVGVGYAVPINQLKTAAEQLRSGRPSWGDAGLAGRITGLSPEEAEIFGVPEGHGAIVVIDSPDEGPGAGKLQTRDAIFKIGDVGISEPGQALRIIRSRKAGETVDFHIVRNGKPRTVSITLADSWRSTDGPRAEWYDGFLGMTLEMWNDQSTAPALFVSPVITKVQGMGPAHRAHIASSQRALVQRGPFVHTWLLDVKTVTGVVVAGVHHTIAELDALQRIAAVAAERGESILLEIELWSRSDPRDPASPLERRGVAFFKVTPKETVAVALHKDVLMAGDVGRATTRHGDGFMLDRPVRAGAELRTP